MQSATLMSHCGTAKVERAVLKQLSTPLATTTHQPVPHWRIIDVLEEALHFRSISIVRDEYAISPDGYRMFGVLDLDYEFTGLRFSIGIRNANDKTMRLAMTVGYRVFVCDNMAFSGDFQPVLAKHTRNLHIEDLISVALDRIRRNFEPLKRTIGEWKANPLTDDEARIIIYEAFVERMLPVPRTLLNAVHSHYFAPAHDEFKERTLWSLSNAFTSGFKQLKPFPQYAASAKLAPFLNRHNKPF